MRDGRNAIKFKNLWDEIDASYHDAALRLGLSDSAMLILYMAYCGGGECLLRDITRQTSVSRQTINSSLRRLEAEGVVLTKAVDGKKKKLQLTDKGAQLAKDTVARVIDVENKIYDSWNNEELGLYFELTERYLKAFRAGVAEL